MGKRIITVLALVLLLTAMPVQATTRPTADGHYSKTFQAERKAKRIKLKKYSCGGTVLYADTKIPKKRITFVRNCIKALPKKVRKRAKRVYFVRKKYYLMTGDSKLKKTYGYEIVPCKEIYIRNTKNSLSVRRILWHEFGHAYDSRNKQFEYSSKKKWKTIVLAEYGYSNDFEEQFADIFAEYFEFLNEPENLYITKLLERK